jgi:hypothetical protein
MTSSTHGTPMTKKFSEVLNEKLFFTSNKIECNSKLIVQKDKKKDDWLLIRGVDELLECGIPATFGKNNQEVYDEYYRKGKAVEDFQTTFI